MEITVIEIDLKAQELVYKWSAYFFGASYALMHIRHLLSVNTHITEACRYNFVMHDGHHLATVWRVRSLITSGIRTNITWTTSYELPQFTE